MQFIEALTIQRLAEGLPYINQKSQLYSYPLWQQLVHVVNHSSYHRGQVTTMLRQLGAEAVSTDFLVYFDEKPKSQRRKLKYFHADECGFSANFSDYR